MDHKGEALIGASVYIEGSFDGTVTAGNGNFQLRTATSGTQTLVTSYLS
ncbi:MAG: carboxypeptidase-like regulatory domain-containing protein [Saprospiraceae bacterium]|nr:carboxypeptidase-like regulatory domain-containing protein [Saprospiraceae bacterium]